VYHLRLFQSQWRAKCFVISGDWQKKHAFKSAKRSRRVPSSGWEGSDVYSLGRAPLWQNVLFSPLRLRPGTAFLPAQGPLCDPVQGHPSPPVHFDAVAPYDRSGGRPSTRPGATSTRPGATSTTTRGRSSIPSRSFRSLSGVEAHYPAHIRSTESKLTIRQKLLPAGQAMSSTNKKEAENRPGSLPLYLMNLSRPGGHSKEPPDIARQNAPAFSVLPVRVIHPPAGKDQRLVEGRDLELH
jgi:hypothetical protein